MLALGARHGADPEAPLLEHCKEATLDAAAPDAAAAPPAASSAVTVATAPLTHLTQNLRTATAKVPTTDRFADTATPRTPRRRDLHRDDNGTDARDGARVGAPSQIVRRRPARAVASSFLPPHAPRVCVGGAVLPPAAKGVMLVAGWRRASRLSPSTGPGLAARATVSPRGSCCRVDRPPYCALHPHLCAPVTPPLRALVPGETRAHVPRPHRPRRATGWRAVEDGARRRPTELDSRARDCAGDPPCVRPIGQAGVVVCGSAHPRGTCDPGMRDR